MANFECVIDALADQGCTFDNGQFGDVCVFPPDPPGGMFELLGPPWRAIGLIPLEEVQRHAEKLGLDWRKAVRSISQCMDEKEAKRKRDGEPVSDPPG